MRLIAASNKHRNTKQIATTLIGRGFQGSKQKKDLGPPPPSEKSEPNSYV